ncbi:MAG TPA: NAD(P)/FAD-dependent oxidoreductase [Flavisolibacter sp.]|nr:NAD(P)/FAD-dependent oxidoreductase [Flavisolibacter sp.]
MLQTQVLIVGASVSGLASAACLQKHGIEYIIIDKEAEVGSPWRHHYDHLHLHTNKSLSNLPYKTFARNIPRYPSRQQVVDYLEEYQSAFNIQPIFNTEAKTIKKENGNWITETSKDTISSVYLIIATGPYGKPRSVHFKGMESFPGKIMHSYEYKTGRDFKDQKVLVVGFGNSACEIAIDLYEQGALPSMAVRSPVNVIPRDLLGIPIISISQIMSRLPPGIADAINAPLLRLLFGDLSKLGLRKLPYGVFRQIKETGTIPLLDIGTIKHIKQGHIKIHGDLDFIVGKAVHFKNGQTEDFDAIIAAIGYDRNYVDLLEVDRSRFEDLRSPVHKQQYFGNDGLYFCGFWVSPMGQIHEIASDARKIAESIAVKEKLL